MSSKHQSRREFIKKAGVAALGSTLPSSLIVPSALAQGKKNRYNILMIVTDQERHLKSHEIPSGYRLPGHERLAKHGTVFQNHQVGSCVCTPSRAVMYTGQHIQVNGMFDNTNFPWSGSMSTDIDTIGDHLRNAGYYTAYKGKWHLTEEFETANNLHSPRKILAEEMEAYGFSDYFGIGDIIAHTEGGYMHDDVISAMSRSWLRGQGEKLRRENKPWFMAVNLVNPHDVMYYNTDLPDQSQQSNMAMLKINREPRNEIYQQKWDVNLPESRHQPLTGNDRPTAHIDYRDSRGVMVGVIPSEDARWRRHNNYYLNCIQDVDNNLVEVLDELDNLGIADNTIIVYTADHGELGGAHGLSGKGATAYREQNNVPLTVVHPEYKGNKKCSAVTSHLDLATTLISMAGGGKVSNLPGKDITKLLKDPEAAALDALRTGALYNYNMFAYIDDQFFSDIGKFLAAGGSPEELANQGFKPNLKKRGAIRTVFDGQYKFSRYFSPLQHHVPETLEDLFSKNDLELYDTKSDPFEMDNLARDPRTHGNLITMMNAKLNQLLVTEVGLDNGQMLPKLEGVDWRLPPSVANIRL